MVLPSSKPILSLVSLLGAAVAMGNAVVMVPSEKYPLPALAFIQVCQFQILAYQMYVMYLIQLLAGNTLDTVILRCIL